MGLRKFSNALVLAPHTDDGELGCGATISRLLREESNVYYAAFSACEESVPVGYPPDILKRELMEAINSFKIPSSHCHIYSHRVRRLHEDRQLILDEMIKLDQLIKPDIVFMPSINDIHQDHKTIAMEGLRAFKRKTILAYEVPWNNYSFSNQAFICVEEVDVVHKINAIKCYNSQKDRPYTNELYIRSLLKVHGVQIGSEFAEVFEIPRLVF